MEVSRLNVDLMVRGVTEKFSRGNHREYCNSVGEEFGSRWASLHRTTGLSGNLQETTRHGNADSPFAGCVLVSPVLFGS